MQLRLAIILSLVVHLLAFAPPLTFSSRSVGQPQPRITVRIEPVRAEEQTLDDSSTDRSAAPRSKAKTVEGSGKFQQQAQRAISKNLWYPADAIKRGLEGDVTLLLILDSNGRVRSAEVARSSGHPILDEAALAAAKGLGRLPGNTRESLVPISFRLD
jgi:periplasmic protein TonB